MTERRSARRPHRPDRPPVPASPANREVHFTLGVAGTRIAEVTRQHAGRIAIDAEPSPEQLHRFHQRLRKLRGAIRLVAGLLSDGRAEEALEVDRRLRRVARLVGEVRDFDVAITHLSDPRLGASSEEPDERVDGMIRRMREEARTGRALLGAFLRSESDRGLFLDAESVMRRAGRRLEGPRAWTACREAAERSRSRVERALKRARRRPDPDRTHRFRMELRKAHTLSDFIDSAVGRAEPSFPGRLSRLQRSLGTLHDLDLLVRGFEGLGHSEADSPWLASEDKRRRALRRELLAQFRKRATRTAIKALST